MAGEEEEKEKAYCIARTRNENVRKQDFLSLQDRTGWAGAGRGQKCLVTHVVFLKEQGLLERGKRDPRNLSLPPAPHG